MASRTTKDQLECRLREMEQKVKEQTAEINSLNDTIRELKVDNREKADVIHEFKEVCSELRKCLADARQKSYAEAASTPKPHEPMTSPLAYAMQAQKALRSREEHEKDLTVVAIGVPESTDENLQEAVQEILGAKGISSDVVEKVWRHGERKDNKNRVVKIKLRNDYNHRLIKYTIGSSSFCRYARNDLSYEELAEDRRLRNYARELNRKEGSYTYVVRDLTIVKKKNPTPFTPFEEQVQEESGYKTVSNSPQ
ncbi:unnamed protein product [Caenorhabditis auriculariae]|uniref:Uncharacterized protein n=1 Tax=Caenorhabditis auriculariae TaxID=2777116 RepID=A0A8S1HNJ7_9PELO|nr:unnamed protein product [Caenorhabditis auriculariae]CAD6196792.1 unnamed protein product [Caenorhabditis auriculariae]